MILQQDRVLKKKSILFYYRIYHHLYWTDSIKDTIEVSDLDGGFRKTLLSDRLQEPRSIAVDPIEGYAKITLFSFLIYQSLLLSSSICAPEIQFQSPP